MYGWNILKAGILAILLLVLLILYTGGRKKDYPAVLTVIILSVPGVLCAGTELMPVVFIGTAFAAAVFKKEDSIFYTLMLYLFMSSLGFLDSKEGIFFLTTGILISLLFMGKRERNQYWYSFLIILSADTVILLLNSSFSIEAFLSGRPAVTLGAVFGAVFIGNLAGNLYQKRMKPPEIKENKELTDLTIDSLLQEDFELYKRLKASEKLYLHADRIAAISESAALAAGLSGNIARAGGLYHEIGKLKGKDYVKEGLTLAKEYHLPEVIVNIIASHNLKADKPSSPEGAVVMLTVSLDAAKEYFLANQRGEEKEAKDLVRLMLKFTDNLFAMRLEKDSLINSKLTVAQYIRLKDFYLDYFGNKEEYLDTEF